MRKILTSLLLVPTVSYAQPLPLNDAIDVLIGTEISIFGKIGYSSQTLLPQNFAFIDKNNSVFGVVMDAGRATREQIQAQCEEELDFILGLEDFCTIEATGILMIEGSSIVISIDEVLSLTP